MKQIIYVIVTLLFTFSYSCDKKISQKLFTIIKVEGYSEAFTKATLKYFDHNTLEYKIFESKLLIENNRLEFKIPFKNSNLYQIDFDNKEIIPISIENTNTISINRIANKNEIEGSESTKKMTSFRSRNEELQAKYFGQLKIDFDNAMKANNQAKIKELTVLSEILIQDYLKEFRQIIVDLGTTPAGYYALQFSDFNKELDFIEKRLATFKKEAPNSLVTKALEKQVNQVKATALGNTPPQFKSKSKKGNLISLSDFEGKIVLIDFWASWCRACRVENPKFATLYKKHHQNNFEIISISQDDSDNQWFKAIENDGIDLWPQIRDHDNSISKLYSISSLPQNILLDKSGKIIAKNMSAEEISKILYE